MKPLRNARGRIIAIAALGLVAWACGGIAASGQPRPSPATCAPTPSRFAALAPPNCFDPSDTNQTAGSLAASQDQIIADSIRGILQQRRDEIQGGELIPETSTSLSIGSGPSSAATGGGRTTTSGGRTVGTRSPGPTGPTLLPVIPGDNPVDLRPGELPVPLGPPPNPGPAPGPGLDRNASERQFSGAPPIDEARFVPNQVLVQVQDTIPAARVQEVAQQIGLTLITSQNFALSGRIIYLFRFPDGRNIRDVVHALERRNQIVAAAQPNFIFEGMQAESAPAAASGPAAALPEGDPAQYVIEKLHLHAVHQQVRGRNVSIAVIDSEVDARHPDLQGAIKERFDATASPSSPDSHGTGMAGAIASRSHLLGVAPAANIIAIKAFSSGKTATESTSYQLLGGIDHAVSERVQIINMSFAGPRDLMIERSLKSARERNIVLVAAAGNAGPNSPPLFPAADPNVIAVTATDYGDRPFVMANRGKYIALAAPGVDVFVAAPNGTYQMTTGTSVASAHVSGVVALLLEARPGLKPAEIRTILTRSAKVILPRDPGFQTGAGLVDPAEALAYMARNAAVARLGAALGYAGEAALANPLAAPLYYKALPRFVAAPSWSTWVQGLGDWERRGARSDTDIARTQDSYGVTAGIDHLSHDVLMRGDDLVTGVFGSWKSARLAYSATATTMRLDGPGVGAYAMWIRGGFSADIMVQQNFFTLAEDFAGAAPSASLTVTSPGVSGDLQYKFFVGRGSFIEPTVGFNWSRAMFSGQAAALGFQDATTLRLQAGARFGTWFDLPGARLETSLSALVYENTIAQGSALASNPALPLAPTDQGVVRGEIGPRLNFRFDGGYSAFVEGAARFGQDLVGGTARAGLRKEW